MKKPLPLLANPFVILLSTWFILLLEALLFMSIFGGYKLKKLMLKVGIFFLFAIFIIHGLPSFGLAMSAALILYLRDSQEIFHVPWDLDRWKAKLKNLIMILGLLSPNFLFAQQSSIRNDSITFYSGDNYLLNGTLSYPSVKKNKEKPKLGVILISGSGVQDRDETIGNHKPFKTIAEYLSNHGVYVLRYDDRGWKQKGTQLSLSLSEQDVQAAINFLKTKKVKNIGLIGHSEGGLLAIMVANTNKSIKFISTLATPCIGIDSLLFAQNEKIFLSAGMDSLKVKNYLNGFYKPIIRSIKNVNDTAFVSKMVFEQFEFYKQHNQADYKLFTGGLSSENFTKIFAKQVNTATFREFLMLNPQEHIKKIRKPILALNGDLDLQVGVENLYCMQNLLTNIHSKSEFKVLKSHNHLFQIAKTGRIAEYFSLKNGVSDDTMENLYVWISNLKK